MNPKEILKGIREFFNAPAVIAPVVNAAPAPEPAPAPAAKPYKLQDGTEIAIAQAGEVPAVGDAVTIGGAPAPEGVHTLEDGATITVDAAGIISAYTPAAPVTNDLTQAPAPVVPVAAPVVQPVAQYEEQFAAQTSAITELREKIAAQEQVIAKYNTTINSLFDLCEKLAETPSAEPATLTGAKKAKFDGFADKKEKSLERFANQLKDKKHLINS
jgi:uncharacterized coiled-coil protein SlyX